MPKQSPSLFQRVKQGWQNLGARTPRWVIEKINEAKAKQLTNLDLTDRSEGRQPLLSHFPEEILELTHLENLSLAQHNLSYLPDSIGQLQNLISLDLKFNAFTEFPESVTQLYNLITLDLSHNNTKALPDSIGQLSQLKQLILTSNHLQNIPESITQLQNLTILDLTANKLTDLPDFIGKLRNLTTLNLHFIDLTAFPDFICDLRNLTTLDLSGNKLTYLPECMTQLQNLTTLNLSFNPLGKFPLSITKLQNLETLILRAAHLIDVPESIEQLRNLRELNLAAHEYMGPVFGYENHSFISALPESITKLQKLEKLEVSGNPLVSPPLEIAEQGIDAIRNYFRQLRQVGEDYIYEAKLLILGEGGAGKTTLAKKIADSNYQLKEEKSTQGVDVTQWSFPIDNEKSFRVNIWDFGGQEIYHATHQFFLTKRSLYILVTDNRKEDTDFYYWLNAVSLLSDNSPLLIVKNEKQDRLRDINERQLRGQFNNLKEVLSANLATNRGLNQLLNTIQYQIKNLPHIGSPLPKTWVRVRERLEKDARNYISLEEYLVICRESGFLETKDSLQLSGYLHDLGVFLHFQDDALLKKTIILKPKWGTDAVYRVLDNQQIIRNLGKFTRADLDRIWSESVYEMVRDELLQLMLKFKLCYEIPNRKDVFIAPQLLTENQPEYEWNEQDNLLLRYAYEFMPKGIITQFIVVMNSFIRKQEDTWKTGVILERENTQAEVIEYYGKRQIHIRIAGAHKKELMTVVIHELDQIHEAYRQLNYDKLIPCNCEECRKNTEPHFYRYEQLQKFIERRVSDVQCGATGNMVNVHGLIDEIFELKPEKKEQMSPVVQNIYYGDHIDRGVKMTENKISITNSTIHGSVVAAENIKDSFNIIEKADIKDDLKEQLKLLTQAVEAMAQELPKEKAEEVAEDMKMLAEQATKERPNPKWYNVSIDGLIKAAENIGKVGEPVIELAGKVLKILAVG